MVSAAGASPETMLSAQGTHNLPFDLTRFVGREPELAAVGEALGGARLVTLTGPGGCGKTRLAIRVATDVVELFPHGCWFVDLAGSTDADLVPALVAQALGVPEQPGAELSEALADALRERELLVLLDNCEHLVDSASALARTLLAACPGVRVLATSRRPFGVPGEVVWRVPPMGSGDAVRLFLERARQRLPSFALTPETSRAISDICDGLDGLPLAIELATARVTVLAVGEIAGMLSNQLTLLAGGDRAAEPRHRSLEAALRWSYDLLDEPQQRCFECLAVFSGWWDLDAVVTCGCGDAPLDALGGLVDQSLVLAETGIGGAARYRMLEPVRQFGLARLAARGGTEAARDAHAAFAIGLAERAAPGLQGPGQLGSLRMLDDAEPDLRSAIAWLLGRGDAERAANLGWSLWLFWWLRGRFAESRRAMEQALGAPLPPVARARAEFVAGTMACGQADYVRAGELLDDSIRLFAAEGEPAAQAYAMSSAGFSAIGRGEQATGVQYLEHGVELALAADDRWSASFMSCFLGTAARAEGDHARAGQLGHRALELAHSVGDREGASMASQLLAGVARDGGRPAEAAGHLREGLQLAAEIGDAPTVAFCLQDLAAVEPDAERAVRLLSAAAALLARSDAAGYVTRPDADAVRDTIATARAGLGEEAFGVAWAAGHELRPAELLAYVLDEPLPEPSVDPDGLTAREAEVLGLIAQGRANKQIASELTISVSTVEQHVTRLYAKIGARGRADATVHALRRGARVR